MSTFQPMWDIEKLQEMTVPMSRKIEAKIRDNAHELEAWMQQAKASGHDVVMVFDGVNTTHYEARPLRPDDV